MLNYELTIIVNASLPQEKKSAVLKKIEDLVNKAGGKVVKINDWGKRSLAYPIKKQTEGCYYLLELKFDSLTAGKLAQKISLEEEIIRSLLIKKESRQIAKQ